MKPLGQLTPGQRCVEAIRELFGQSPLYVDPTGASALGNSEQRDMVRFYVAPPSTDGRLPARGSGA